MSCEINYGVVPAADMRRFRVGQLILTPVWVNGYNENDLSGWQAEVIVGKVVSVEDDYDGAPDASPQYWQNLVIEGIVPGRGLRQLEHSSYETIPLPVVK